MNLCFFTVQSSYFSGNQGNVRGFDLGVREFGTKSAWSKHIRRGIYSFFRCFKVIFDELLCFFPLFCHYFLDPIFISVADFFREIWKMSGNSKDSFWYEPFQGNVNATLRARNYEDKHDWACVLRESSDSKSVKRVFYTDNESLSPMTPTQAIMTS